MCRQHNGQRGWLSYYYCLQSSDGSEPRPPTRPTPRSKAESISSFDSLEYSQTKYDLYALSVSETLLYANVSSLFQWDNIIFIIFISLLVPSPLLGIVFCFCYYAASWRTWTQVDIAIPHRAILTKKNSYLIWSCNIL